MKSTVTPWIVVVSVCLYHWLLSLGPLEFQHEYTQPMLQDFRQCCRVAYQQKGGLGVLGLWWPVFGEGVTGMLFENILPPLLNLGTLLLGMTIFIFSAQLLITAIAQALTNSTFSTRMQRFIRIPMFLTTLGMLVALAASIVEDILLSREAPQLITTQEMILWTSLMAIATGLALFALWSGLRERPGTSTSRA